MRHRAKSSLVEFEARRDDVVQRLPSNRLWSLALVVIHKALHRTAVVALGFHFGVQVVGRRHY